VTYNVVLARKAEEDRIELIKQGYGKKIKELIKILEEDPFQDPPRYKQLTGEMKGMFSRRINIEHRMVYEVLPSEDREFKGTVKVVRMKTHYKGMIPMFFLLASN
jgi:Txe/YoeB family toxin of toxin-antitoxin system